MVQLENGSWRATIGFESRQIHLGVFLSYEDAVKAREEAEIKYLGKVKNAY